MNLHIRAGIIPEIKEDPEQALIVLGKHQDIQDDLKAFLRFSNDDRHFINLHTEKHVSVLASLPLYTPTSISKLSD